MPTQRRTTKNCGACPSDRWERLSPGDVIWALNEAIPEASSTLNIGLFSPMAEEQKNRNS